jgi:iron-sulfur cluster repair protein YtfE (RIC family)
MSTDTDSASVPTPRSAQDRSAQSQGPDLTVFLIAHRVYRHEFARLAAAAASAPSRAADAARYAAIEEQIALMMRSLHAHHTGEDLRLWPMLRERDPAACIVLDRLEEEHEHIDPLLVAASDRSIPLPDRARYLDELSVALNTHLDHEEAEAVPLLRRHLTQAEWDADSKAHMKEVRSDTPMFFGTMTDYMSEAEFDGIVAGAPKILVLLYKLSWRRRWAKRRALVYGR